MRPPDYDLLKSTRLYRAAGSEIMDRLTRGAFVQALPKGAELLRQGDEADFVHLVLSGSVGLMAEAPGQDDTVVEIFSAGELFVAPAAILRLPYLVTARVVEPARILMIPAETFRRALTAEHKLALAVVETLARHWRVLVRQIKDLKLKSAAQRLGSFLLVRLDEPQAATGTVRLFESKRLLAARLGMTPESLSRAFAQLKSVGVAGKGGRIALADVPRLREFCQFDSIA